MAVFDRTRVCYRQRAIYEEIAAAFSGSCAAIFRSFTQDDQRRVTFDLRTIALVTAAITRWGRFEISLEVDSSPERPVHDEQVYAEFEAPSERRHRAPGFWDGGRTWRIRFSPSEVGTWRGRCRGESFAFECIPGESGNPFLQHGPLRISKDRRHFEHADGTPFFWLGDTAWNGPLKADLQSWDLYLADRKSKGFNVVQFVMTQWLASAGNADGRLAYTGTDPIEIDPVFFQWMDARIDRLNDAGFAGAGVIAWAATWHQSARTQNPGTSLPDDEIVTLARYMLARYGAHHMIWILAADGHYTGEEAERWRRIGRKAFAGFDVLATMHPGGQVWVMDEFRNEPWFSFNSYQSGHWRSEKADSWIHSGPVAQSWRTHPIPHVNLEFCYEGHEDFEFRSPFDDADIRRAAYASVLAAPPAGLTYGGHGVWSWEPAPNPPMNHPKTGIARPWFEAIHLPGSISMLRLKQLFESVNWRHLRPAPELVEKGFISAGLSEEGDLAILYLPHGGSIEVRTELLKPGLTVEAVNPVNGERTELGQTRGSAAQHFQFENNQDQLLLFHWRNS